MAWIRYGECNRCGDCCKGDPFTGEPGGYCPLLQLKDNLLTCTDREQGYYLKGCNVFPTHPSQISDKPNCSYEFQWVNDGN